MDIKLITLVEKFPHLFDKTTKLYKDKLAGENSWQYIAKELHLSVTDCMNRWSSIRNRFSKERAKVMPSGSAGDAKEWILMKYLTFLNKVVRKRRTFGNVTETTSSHEPEVESQTEEITYLLDEDTGVLLENVELNREESDVEDDTIVAPNTPSSSSTYERSTKHEKLNVRGKRATQNMEVVEKLGDALGTFQRFVAARSAATNSENDPIRSFCLSLVPHLNKMSERTLIKAKIDMMQVIQKYIDSE